MKRWYTINLPFVDCWNLTEIFGSNWGWFIPGLPRWCKEQGASSSSVVHPGPGAPMVPMFWILEVWMNTNCDTFWNWSSQFHLYPIQIYTGQMDPGGVLVCSLARIDVNTEKRSWCTRWSLGASVRHSTIYNIYIIYIIYIYIIYIYIYNIFNSHFTDITDISHPQQMAKWHSKTRSAKACSAWRHSPGARSKVLGRTWRRWRFFVYEKWGLPGLVI